MMVGRVATRAPFTLSFVRIRVKISDLRYAVFHHMPDICVIVLRAHACFRRSAFHQAAAPLEFVFGSWGNWHFSRVCCWQCDLLAGRLGTAHDSPQACSSIHVRHSHRSCRNRRYRLFCCRSDRRQHLRLCRRFRRRHLGAFQIQEEERKLTNAAEFLSPPMMN
jgi:hypothetical protein